MISKKLTAYTKQLLLALAIIALPVLTNAADILPKMIEPQEGNEYYTRYNFKYEKGRHVTTNYWRGELIPINTKVTLVSMSKKRMVLDIDGQTVKFVNVKKHTKRGMEAIASELLSPKKIPLNKLSSELRSDIEEGILRLGMTKEQVLMTRGYPPRHKTPSTKANLWVYWSSKFVQRSLAFRKGKLTKGRGLY